MRTRLFAIAMVLLPCSGAAQGAPPDGGHRATVDLDLHAPPAGATPQPAPAGSVLRPPRSSEPTRYQLRPLPGGGYFYQGPTFEARIAVDGTVAFSTSRLSLARDVDNGVRVRSGDPVTNPGPLTVGGGPSLHFDANDEYLRLLGKDPARDAKAAFMGETLELRMKMAFAARRELREAALADLPRRLAETWVG